MTHSIATLAKDVYKEFHVHALNPKVTNMYANYTSRSGRLSNIPNNETVAFVGLQYFIKDYLINEFNETFFKLPKEVAINQHKRIMSAMVGYEVNTEYLESLHDLGYLPLRIKALPEGSMVPYQVAPFTITNTVEGFGWLPLMIETVTSAENWPIQTSATTASAYFKAFKKAFLQTGGPMELLPFMCHDFSFRGMMGRHAAAMSGFGHLASGFAGTDTIPAVLFAEKYYGADVDTELVGASVNATEHSVTCSWIEEGEKEFIRYMMNGPAKTGILSVVSDTWDFWRLVTEYLPEMKDEIMSRDGKVVIRPDSGDPVKILTGYTYSDNINVEGREVYQAISGNYYHKEDWHTNQYDDWSLRKGATPIPEHEVKGLIECLWDTFGGTTTDEGYKLLDEHIGAIYGDAITIERQEQIIARLIAKGFVPSVVLGVGSYSYQYVTRDTHGSAVKATNMVKDGESIAIFKDPKTDSKKKSAKGLLRVELEDGKYVMYDEQTAEQEKQGLLETVFLDGELTRTTTLAEIRERMTSCN
ncbi:MAG: nicotinate phosphoribosyltransferase [Aureispira sp.]|nr:nicotinate phosphoribosyltransferase [Aureispira sp.]